MRAAFNKIDNDEEAGSLNFTGYGDIITFESLIPFSVKYPVNFC